MTFCKSAKLMKIFYSEKLSIKTNSKIKKIAWVAQARIFALFLWRQDKGVLKNCIYCIYIWKKRIFS